MRYRWNRLGQEIQDLDKNKYQNQTKPSSNQKYYQNHGFGQFLGYSDMLSIKMHELELENAMVTSDEWFEHIQNLTKPNKNQRYSQNHGIGLFYQQWHVVYQKLCTQAEKFNGSLRLVIWTNQKPNKKSKTKNIAKTMVLAFFHQQWRVGYEKTCTKAGKFSNG